ncbi:hypothetical protein QNI16_15870 [Cytophagaceae bacterium YF14B1]|uniref:Uncharacterized protein n=1 Tax=Xanthocytophaga flava TaxID=3048013 RepID=A0AAE3U6L3_9BACT|nr:hypothetical protein [Xanthocytophaga flavus]MDJ1481979.1 hypothetical protein [Xanthocytophaga flavus]
MAVSSVEVELVDKGSPEMPLPHIDSIPFSTNNPQSENSHCQYTHRYSIKERRRFYPFNKVKRIEVISFENEENEISEETEQSLPEIEYIPAKPDINNDSVIEIRTEPIYKIKTDSLPVKVNRTRDSLILSDSQINKLTDILYNYSYHNGRVMQTISLCYTPRHKIVFYNVQNKAFAFIELCFECQNEEHSPKVQLGDFCSEKWDLLKNFFREIGITYGLAEKK